MSNTNSNNNKNDEIDFKLIYKIILQSKKFIFFFTLIMTLLLSTYSFYKIKNSNEVFMPIFTSEATVRIGSYKDPIMECVAEKDIRDNLDGWRCKKIRRNFQTIEEFSELKKILETNFPNTSALSNSFTYQGNHIFKIQVKSDSISNSEKELLKITSFVDSRHEDLIRELKIKNNNSYLSFLDKYNSELLTLDRKIKKMNIRKNLLLDKLLLLDLEIKKSDENFLKFYQLEKKLTSFDLETLQSELSNLEKLEKNSTVYEIHGSKLQALYQLSNSFKNNNSEEYYLKTVIENHATKNTVELIVSDTNKNMLLIFRSFILGLMISLTIVLLRFRKMVF